MIEVRWLRPAPADEAILMGLLDEAEQARAQRFHHPADRLAYAAAHALLRSLLSEAGGGGEPQDWRFVRAPAGKPRLDRTAEEPDLRFSLSHARGLVACAVAIGIELGIDVEPLADLPDVLRLARDHFSVAEAEGLQALAEPARSEAFLHLWTLKEAAHKASGAGLQDRLERPQFNPACITDSDDHPSPVHPSDWLFWSFRPDDQFVVSLASARISGAGVVRGAEVTIRPCGLHP